MPNKIAIVGWSSTYKHAPYDDKSWDIWIFNHRIDKFPRYNLHFDLHNTKRYDDTNSYFKFLLNNKEKSVVTGEDSRLKDCKIYPKQDMINKYGDFFTNTMSWLIAYAIEQNPKQLGIYGIDCLATDEYIQQRPSVLYFLGIAKGRGIDLIYPEDCKLFRKSKLYWNL